ncbi:DUF1365 family protein [Vibrio anguillarum]|uniref:DUF1365 domain-containing protein n=1 Tax=Vibrio TaxID=662 RepID=UPI00097E3BED|nr:MULTISPECIES: DUF1365 family protein [Vibrio]PSD41085.1 DUF1365 domain-containing protein [Vibrio sp. V02_P2A34T13]MBF4254937.1 DUF1365 family protein [Vibrio anguillarum]MBF4277188.1 DUF1365 family protein [Vibrio anguillarum]MBF4281893.1 DUF1365 family protein [Vibrio anguillarum]MBF4289260.1 DUF1365 family protein [Vibrio anguillarum]
METEPNSCLMVGMVRHRRFTPIEHALNYPLFMPCIDLDELDQLSDSVWGFGEKWWHWARFQRADYLGEGDLKQCIQDKVHELTGDRCSGKVIAVCHLRYLGIYFSPVNFYYLYDQQGEWQYLLAEVSNTPWNQRHYYAVKAQAGEEQQQWRHQKAFHVSPFNPIDQRYHWKLKPLGSSLSVHLECHKEGKVFDATLSMKAQPFNSKNLLKLLIKTPVMAVKVTIGIYWHALKLWLKGAPFYSNPHS